MTFLTMLQAFRDWTVTATGLADSKVRMAESKGVRPSPPYATIQAMETVKHGHDERAIVDASGNVTIFGHRTTTVRLAGFGADAYDYVEKARLGIARDDLIRQALGDSIAVQGVAGNILNIASLRSTDFEDRYILDFFVGWVPSVTDNVDGGTIENIDSTGDIGAVTVDIEV